MVLLWGCMWTGTVKTLEINLTQGLYLCMCFFLSTVLNFSSWFSLILKTILRARSIIIPFRWRNWGLGRLRNLSKVSKWPNQDLITDNLTLNMESLFVYYTVCMVLYYLSVFVFGFPLESSPPSLYKKFCILLDQEFLTSLAYES